jgi:hypothetical protein
MVSATRLTCLIRAPASQRGEFDPDSPVVVQPASRRATFSCGPSNRASNSVMSSEVSSARIRNRASGEWDTSIGPPSASIATLSGFARSVMVTI